MFNVFLKNKKTLFFRFLTDSHVLDVWVPKKYSYTNARMCLCPLCNIIEKCMKLCLEWNQIIYIFHCGIRIHEFVNNLLMRKYKSYCVSFLILYHQKNEVIHRITPNFVYLFLAERSSWIFLLKDAIFLEPYDFHDFS